MKKLKLRLNVKQVRERKGISQLELCELTGYSQPQLSAVENQKYKAVNYDTLEAIINALDINDPRDLFSIVEEGEDDLITAGAFAKLLGISRQAVYGYAERAEKSNYSGDFLKPDEWINGAPRWYKSRAEEFATTYKKQKDD